MTEFLLEILCEEIPAGLQPWAIETLEAQLRKRLTVASLTVSDSHAAVTPRRLTVCFQGMSSQKAERIEERRGPRSDLPSRVIDKFFDQIHVPYTRELRTLEKGNFWFAIIVHPGEATADLLPSIVIETILTFPWPRSMRWGPYAVRWIRPLRQILAIFDGVPLSGGLRLLHPPALAARTDPDTLPFLDQTYVTPSEPFAVASWDDYQTKLRDRGVILHHQERAASIRTQIQSLCDSSGLTWQQDPALVTEVAGLTENPRVLKGRIDSKFMTLPPEVLMQAMRRHQKYFVATHQGNFAQSFFFVTNGALAEERHPSVISGNQRVLTARLRDAAFFWEQDLKQSPLSRLDKLKSVIFHHRLGSMYDKTLRLVALCETLAPEIDPNLSLDNVKQAALLAKVDLVTEMVGEFPDLQGIMGSYYASQYSEPPAVAQAIREHYRPLGPQDPCPQAPLSLCLALADKIDTLIGFFSINEKPSSSKDPMALRRSALGLLRLILENKRSLSLKPFLEQAILPYSTSADPETVIQDVLTFLRDRFHIFLRDRYQIRPDILRALPDALPFFTLFQYALTLKTFLSISESQALIAAYRRGRHLLEIEEGRDQRSYPPTPQDILFVLPEERLLFDALNQTEKTIDHSSSFLQSLEALRLLCHPIDRFFEAVLINAPDPEIRRNRLRLLSRLRDVCHRVADFSRLEP